MTPVLDRKEREFQRREEDILAAAHSLFQGPDWQAVTIDQIAAKAEIGKGTIYKHFESKEQIYAKLVVSKHKTVLEELRRIDFTQPALKVLGQAMDLFWRLHRSAEDRRLMSFCRRDDFQTLVGPALSKELDALDEAFSALMDPVVERGIKDGSIIDRPVPMIVLGLHAALIGVVEMQGSECMETGLDPEQQYQVVKEFALRGIASR